MTGTVQNLNIYLRDAKDNRLLQSMSADFRGNTGESLPRENPLPRREGGLGGLVLLLHVGG